MSKPKREKKPAEPIVTSDDLDVFCDELILMSDAELKEHTTINHFAGERGDYLFNPQLLPKSVVYNDPPHQPRESFVSSWRMMVKFIREKLTTGTTALQGHDHDTLVKFVEHAEMALRALDEERPASEVFEAAWKASELYVISNVKELVEKGVEKLSGDDRKGQSRRSRTSSGYEQYRNRVAELIAQHPGEKKAVIYERVAGEFDVSWRTVSNAWRRKK